MSRRIETLAILSALVFGLCLTGHAQVMPLPAAQQLFEYPPTALPVTSADPAMARPIGVGPVAEGGDTIRLRVSLLAFSGPVDLYVGIMAPAIDPYHLYLVRSDGQLMIFETDLVPWKTAVTSPVDEALFPDISVWALPPGQYHCYLLATPAGNKDLTSYDLWHTYFDVRNTAGGCGNYNGSRSFSVTYDHHYVVDQGGFFHQDLFWSGAVPLILGEDNNLYGAGTVTYSTEYFSTEVALYCSGSTTVDVILNGKLYFNEYCQAMLEITFSETGHPTVISCTPMGGGVVPAFSNRYELTFPVIDGATVTGPPMGPGVTGSSTYILHVGH